MLIQKIRNLPIGVKASVAYAVASILQSGLAFITSPIFTRILTQNEYGQVSVYYSLTQLFGTVALFSLHAGCMDIGLQENKTDRSVFIFSTLILSNIITAITGGVLFFLWPFIKNYISISKFLLMIMFISFVLSPALTFWTRLERFEYRYKLSSVITYISALFSSVCAILAVLYFKAFNHVYTRIVGALIPLFPIYIILYARLAHNAHFRINTGYWKFCFFFNLPFLPHYMSAYILGSSDRVMIAYLQGNEQAACYSFAYSLVAVATIIWTAINNSIVPFTLEKYEKKEYREVSDTVIPILFFFGGACVFIMLFAPEIISLLGTSQYKEAVFVIPPVITSAFFQALYFVFTNILYYMKKPQYVMYASISSGVLNIVLNYLFIPVFGYIAAAYTTLFSYMMQAFVDYILARKLVGEDIYEGKKIILMSVGILLALVTVCILYKTWILRYSFILLFFFILLIKRKKIFSYLNIMRKKSQTN